MLKIENNATTGEVVEIALTAQEVKDRETMEAAWQAAKVVAIQAETEKATEKAALLARMGLTEDEARLLLG